MKTINFIPRGDSAFDVFQKNFILKVQPKLAIWGISPTDFNILIPLQVTWTTFWAKASDESKRTREDVRAKTDARKIYEKALRNFIRQWLAFNSKITDAEREGLGLTVKDTHPTARIAVTDAPFSMIKSISGARIEITCRVENDSTRTSLPPAADGVEMRYQIGGTAPISPNELSKTTFSAKSRFILELNIADAGKRLFAYLRWKNNSNDTKSGPWSKQLSTIISD